MASWRPKTRASTSSFTLRCSSVRARDVEERPCRRRPRSSSNTVGRERRHQRRSPPIAPAMTTDGPLDRRCEPSADRPARRSPPHRAARRCRPRQASKPGPLLPHREDLDRQHRVEARRAPRARSTGRRTTRSTTRPADRRARARSLHGHPSAAAIEASPARAVGRRLPRGRHCGQPWSCSRSVSDAATASEPRRPPRRPQPGPLTAMSRLFSTGPTHEPDPLHRARHRVRRGELLGVSASIGRRSRCAPVGSR